MMDAHTELNISYQFRLPDGSQRIFPLHIDPRSLSQAEVAAEAAPEWTRLAFNQCRHCPLRTEQTPACPVAIRLAPLVKICATLHSHDTLYVVVETPQRSFSQTTTAQRGISSLLGLVVATSGCPHTEFLKPMARFHLPFASEEETIYRATTMYLLAQYFVHRRGGAADWDMQELARIYQNLQIVNKAMAERLRVASQQDAAVNAVVLLDLFAKAMPYSIEDSVSDLQYLFEAYLAPASLPANGRY